jgi:hypothetical protein
MITLDEFTILYSDPEYKFLKQETLPSGLWISTVWLGMNMEWREDLPRKIFETMVFESRYRLTPIAMYRYSTEDEALEFHDQLVKRYKEENSDVLYFFKLLDNIANEFLERSALL